VKPGTPIVCVDELDRNGGLRLKRTGVSLAVAVARPIS
jgi:hypothetical protein